MNKYTFHGGWGGASLAARSRKERKRAISHEPSGRVLSDAAHIWPAGEVIEIEAEAILYVG
jgi:hypothetical protein